MAMDTPDKRVGIEDAERDNEDRSCWQWTIFIRFSRLATGSVGYCQQLRVGCCHASRFDAIATLRVSMLLPITSISDIWI